MYKSSSAAGGGAIFDFVNLIQTQITFYTYLQQTGWGLGEPQAPRSDRGHGGRSALQSFWTYPTPGCSCPQSWTGWAPDAGGRRHRTHCCSGRGMYPVPMLWILDQGRRRPQREIINVRKRNKRQANFSENNRFYLIFTFIMNIYTLKWINNIKALVFIDTAFNLWLLSHLPFILQILTCLSSAPDTMRGMLGWKAAQLTPRSWPWTQKDKVTSHKLKYRSISYASTEAKHWRFSEDERTDCPFWEKKNPLWPVHISLFLIKGKCVY